MAARSRRPWLSVVLGLVLGFTAASWLIAPKVAELSDKKRRGASLCSYYGRPAGPGAAAGAAAPGGQQAPPEAAAVLGGTSFRSSPWELPPAAEEGTVSSPAAGGEGEPEEEEEGAGKRRGRPGGSHNGSGDWGAAPGCARPRNFLYVGVMTAQKYLGSRAVAAQRTWAPSVPGRVEFFSSQGSAAPRGLPPLPVVALPGVDDSYPPQKKSFMMIKYMHDHYLDKYEWFMRADDDVYIKGHAAEATRTIPASSKSAAGKQELAAALSARAQSRRRIFPSPASSRQPGHPGATLAERDTSCCSAGERERLHGGEQHGTSQPPQAAPAEEPAVSRCPICLGDMKKPAYVAFCLHSFCFTCILRWARRVAECPLCRQPLDQLLHSVRGDDDYEEYVVGLPACLQRTMAMERARGQALQRHYNLRPRPTTNRPSAGRSRPAGTDSAQRQGPSNTTSQQAPAPRASQQPSLPTAGERPAPPCRCNRRL
ncbi:chondroitin sulfate synthase 3-like isoform X2 [Buteo buteo]|uniref:chondroitin sulfate synthase 3-like isoform X2 n=1 Tax=Buteo buteo TaxID=30397 RepID=UPI003EBE0ADF